MATSIYSVDSQKIKNLQPREATELMRDLLWCEGGRLQLKNIVISPENITTADGGIDASAELVCSGQPTQPASFHFQIKTGLTFKPWTKDSVTKELYGGKKLAKSTPRYLKSRLGHAVRHCLDSGGVYVVVTLGHNLIPSQHTAAVNLFESEFKRCGYKNAEVEVWGIGQLAQMIERYPSLSLDLSQRGAGSRFQNIKVWGGNSDMKHPAELGVDQQGFINEVRNLLAGDEIQHVRVIGEPGAGKTRLVLEALNDGGRLAAETIYVSQASDFLSSSLLTELIQDDREYHALLVVDECDEKDRASICKSLMGRKRFKLVTIDHGPESSSDGQMKVIQFPKLADEQVNKILQSYTGEGRDLHRWIPWCEGSARVAHAVGDNLMRNPDDILKPPANVDIWDRFIVGYTEGADADRTRTVLQHIALFRKFGFKPPVASEGQFIAKISGKVDGAITAGQFDKIVTRLVSKRILQGGHTLRIVPRALHVYLWKQWWETYGQTADLASIMKEIPDSLRRWFLDMLIYANGVGPAKEAIGRVLTAPKSRFSTKKFVESKEGSKFIEVMAEADPESTLIVLERTIGTGNLTKREPWEDYRSELTHALRKIAVWERLFERAARLLSKLATDDVEDADNEARTALKGLFQLHGAPTQASGRARLQFMESLLASKDGNQRVLALNLFESFFNTRGGVKFVGVEHQGLGEDIKFWRGYLWSDYFELWTDAFGLMISKCDPSDSDWQVMLSRTVIKACNDMLLLGGGMDRKTLDVLDAHRSFPGADPLALSRVLVERIKYPHGMVDATKAELQSILDAMGTGPFEARFNRFAVFNLWDEDWVTVGNGIVESPIPIQRLAELAKEFANDLRGEANHLGFVSEADGYRVDKFGVEVAKLSSGDEFDFPVLMAAGLVGNGSSKRFLWGYLSGVKSIDHARWETLALDLLQGVPERWMLDSAVTSGYSVAVIDRLLALLANGHATSTDFLMLRSAYEEKVLGTQEMSKVFSGLLASKESEAAHVALELASYWLGKGGACSESLIWKMLSDKRLRDGRLVAMHSYHWKVVAEKFRKLHPSRDVELLREIFGGNDFDNADIRTSLFEVAAEVCALHPTEGWKVISQRLLDDGSSWSVAHWLGEAKVGKSPRFLVECFDSKSIINWVAKAPRKRSAIIVQSLPRTLAADACGRLTHDFVESFCGDQQISDHLMSHFLCGTISGPVSGHRSRQRDDARQWINATKVPKVREWLNAFINYLNKAIESERISEERYF